MDDLLKAVNEYIIKIATAAADARFTEMVANKLTGNEGDLNKHFADKAEAAVDNYVETKSFDKVIKDAVESEIDNMDLTDAASNAVRAAIKNVSISINVD